MIEKLHQYLEEKVLGGLDLKTEFVPIDMTSRDFDRFQNMAKEAQLELLPMHSMNAKLRIFKYHGVVLKIRVTIKTSDFLK